MPHQESPRELRLPRALIARVRRFIVDHELIERGDCVLAGVSGGPDSTCLLLILAALRGTLHFDLHAAYFDHRLRGERVTERERRFLRALAAQLSVPFHAGAGDVRARAKKEKRSLEDAARELRYRFLATTARRVGARVVAVGHSKDDQGETVLMHIIRGSGLRGLAGMSALAAWPVRIARRGEVPALVRPLLCLSREETEAACEAMSIVPLRDPTNRSPKHLRNRVRHELLPVLRRYNPRIEDALVRLADAAAADADAVDAVVADGVTCTSDELRIGRRWLGSRSPGARRHAIADAFKTLFGEAKGISERHVLAVAKAASGPAGRRLDLPQGVIVDVSRDAIVFSNRTIRRPGILPARRVHLPVPGSVRFGRWRFQAEVLPKRRAMRPSNDPFAATLDASACGGRLSVRRRGPGDRFHPLGMAGVKKLQDFFVDAGVPRGEREGVPLVCSEQGIAWVVGHRPAEWAKMTSNTERVLILRATRESP